MPTTYPVVTAGGPQFRRCEMVEKKYPSVLGPRFYDGGQDSFVSTSSPSEIVWELEYDALTSAEAATLDAHNDSCYDTHLSFTFTDPATGTLHAGVKYLEYQRGGRRKPWYMRRVRLIKRP